MSDSKILDLSSILSINSTQIESIQNEISEENTTRFVNLENVNLNLINSLNKDFIDLGYESILGQRQTDYNILFKNSLDLIQRYRRQLITIERIQDQNHKLDKENELFLKRQQSLKDSIDNSASKLSVSEEKCRQFQIKINESVKNLKTATDENRKLQLNFEQRDKQYKNDRKKLEKEIEKLKDRIQTLSIGKNKEISYIDLSEPIFKNTNGPRATWNIDNNNSKKQLELYSELIKDYDKKLKEIIVENTDLKQFLAKIFTDLERFVYNFENKSCEESEEKFHELINLPYEDVYKTLNKEFESKIKLLDFLIRNQNTIERIDLSISSINSLNETLNKENNKTQILNETNEFLLNKKSDLNKNLKAFDSKPFISNTSSMSSSSLSSTASNDSNSRLNSQIIGDLNLNDEKTKLALEKKHFYEEKLKLEQESIVFRKIAIELDKQKKQFQNEQESYFKSKLFSSFIVNKPNNSSE